MAVIGLLALVACRRDSVTHVRVPKAQPVRPAALQSAAPVAGSKLGWTLPRGWTEALSGGMRYATLKPAVPGRIEATVVVLPGPAGGELGNVNRWRGQLGLPPVDESALASVRETHSTKIGPVSVFDFRNEERSSRVIVAMAMADGNSWFFKMTGDLEPVSTAKPEFVRLLESLRLEER